MLKKRMPMYLQYIIPAERVFLHEPLFYWLKLDLNQPGPSESSSTVAPPTPSVHVTDRRPGCVESILELAVSLPLTKNTKLGVDIFTMGDLLTWL